MSTDFDRARQRLTARRTILATLAGFTSTDARAVLCDVLAELGDGAEQVAPAPQTRRFAHGNATATILAALGDCAETSLHDIAVALYGENPTAATRRKASMAVAEARRAGLVRSPRHGFWCAVKADEPAKPDAPAEPKEDHATTAIRIIRERPGITTRDLANALFGATTQSARDRVISVLELARAAGKVKVDADAWAPGLVTNGRGFVRLDAWQRKQRAERKGAA